MSDRPGMNQGLIKPGDIMVKYNDGSAVNNLISFGQIFGRGQSKYTHAGIASSWNTIIEMDGHGLQQHDLTTENAQIRYDVFRCVIKDVGAGAAAAAEMMLAGFRTGNTRITYDALGAFASVSSNTTLQNRDTANTVLDRLLAGGDTFFCSGHVVLCYQMACSQGMAQSVFPIEHSGSLFGLESNCYQPAYLHKILTESQHFWKVGKFRGATWMAP